MQETLEEVGSRLRELRELSKVTVEDMADYLKMPVEKYNCYEGGKLDIPASLRSPANSTWTWDCCSQVESPK
jgi:hypothetical protein